MCIKVYCQNLKEELLQKRGGDLEVYYGIVDSFADMVPVFYNYLPDHEKARANRFKKKSDYNSYISVHALLRIELSKLMNIEPRSIGIKESLTGKPFATDKDFPFSISRSFNSFAFVIGRGDQYLGVDIEQVKPEIDFKSIFRTYYSPDEQLYILQYNKIPDQKKAFYELWTRKEALLKATGIGINTELSKVQVLEGDNHIDIGEEQAFANTFTISTVLKNKLMISIASSIDYVPEFKDVSLSDIIFPSQCV
jgi:4'-phosphopantetheinyl transferase